MSADYGYFGKGSTGYAHYMTAPKRNFGSGGGGGSPGCMPGCLSMAAVMVLGVAAIVALLV
ncbi:MAG: HFLK protein [Faecalibacterium sp.]|nr:HFLK protein [Faecalibacterium sp.]